MAHISEYTIEKIRSRADIIDIISPYVSLKKRGRNHFGVCPFHSEKTASFSVNSEKQIYKCFGCGKGGSSIDFIMEIEKLGFVDAIKFLADQYSIQIEENNSNSNKVSISEKLYEINTIVSDMYNKNLFLKKNSVHVEYFLKRGLTMETINEFLLGFSFSKDTILNTFRGKYDSAVMKSSGLFIETKKGYIDRFRDRIMFTLFNNTGKVIGFAGRATKKNDLAKYMNSPETPVYYKSKTLYGIHKTKSNISKEDYGVIVEGYMDFLQVYQNGVKNVVAVAGTSLTDDHAHILKRITNNITIAYDGDLAGVTAAIRAGFVLLKNGLEPSIARIPAGSDPDDWVKNEGINPFKNSLDNTVSLLSFSYEQHQKRENNNPAIFINETLSEIVLINDKVIAELKLTELSSVTGISIDSINDNYSKLIDKKNYKPKIENKPPKDKSNLKNIEYDLIKLCFSKDITIRELISRSLDTSWLTDPKIIRIYNQISLHLNSKYEPDATVIMDQLKNKEDHEQLASILFEMDKIIPTIKMTQDCINRINYLWLIAELENLRAQLKEAEDNFQNEDEIISDISKIQSKINSLRGEN